VHAPTLLSWDALQHMKAVPSDAGLPCFNSSHLSPATSTWPSACAAPQAQLGNSPANLLINQGGYGHTTREPPGVSLPSGSRTRNLQILDPAFKPLRCSGDSLICPLMVPGRFDPTNPSAVSFGLILSSILDTVRFSNDPVHVFISHSLVVSPFNSPFLCVIYIIWPL
jgi:hypothetical protein